MNAPLTDTLARPLRDLRISVTDRCNFRCIYCMPKCDFGPDHTFIPHEAILRYGEIERLARIFVGLGVEKIRLTGGEPLMRRDVEELVRRMAALEGLDDLALTTNGSILDQKAAGLADAGLHRITVSLDAVDDSVFKRVNDVDFPVSRVLDGIDEAARVGLTPLKVNMVVKRGVNEDQIVPMARHFHDRGHTLRFIEFMDVGTKNGWRLDDVVPAVEILDRVGEAYPLERVPPAYHGEVAARYRYTDGAGEIGVVSSVTNPFCQSCTRVRLSAEGLLYTCLFAKEGHDIKTPLREDATDEDLAARIAKIWSAREDRYSELRTIATPGDDRVEMSYIGG